MTSDLTTTDVVVRDGSTVCLRPTTSDDVEGLLRFLESLSVESRYFRFFGSGTRGARALASVWTSPTSGRLS